MSDKMRDDAIREAARNHAGDEYFNADRAYLLVSPYSGRIFDAGFDRGWQAAQSVPPKPDYSVTQLQRMKSLMGKLGLATDESLEAFCLDADRQLSRVITAMEKFMAKQFVPVVGEPVAYLHADKDGKVLWSESCVCEDAVWPHIDDDDTDQSLPVYRQPTTSITAAELERLRKDAERGRLLIKRGEWLRFDHDTPDAYALLAVRVPYTADLSCSAMREDAIDAAIAAEGTSNG